MSPIAEIALAFLALLVLGALSMMLRWWHKSFGGAWLFAISGFGLTLVRAAFLLVVAFALSSLLFKVWDGRPMAPLQMLALIVIALGFVLQITSLTIQVRTDAHGAASEAATRQPK